MKCHPDTVIGSVAKGFCLLTVGLLSACGTVTAVVPEAEGVEHVSGLSMNCKKPYVLTQTCSGFSGATLEVEISDFRYKIAGTEDGSIVLLMGAKPNSDALSGKSTESANIAYEVTRKLLKDRDIEVSLVEPLSMGSYLAGYIVTTDGDAYRVLSEYAVER